ncbi:hypothetical protein DMB38_12785 [Streptomyces sp. WAC 06738]|uniref:hypothetical protein n=1 Tax=Streptomyces sp. WAC 06738 TaxID=2203210 RepID=UPI000F71A016|nr:hypothetical protein [Streptomyces sp. WAC 06738]AZM46572.1 hypothetical protein DMB38_12785 [Streptomyces sp. WAC 06738]
MTDVTKYQIEAPVRTFTGESVGVRFDKGTGYVDDSTKEGRAAIEYFRRHGYGVAPAPDKTEAERVQELVTGTPTQRGPLEEGEFDPSGHQAPDVLAYLQRDDVDETEARRVLDAEAASKDRKTVTKEREAILATKQSTDDPAAGQADDDTKGAGL